MSNTHGGEGGASTSEMAWTLLLAAARDLTNAERGMRAGRWHEGVRVGTVLEGRRLGVVGLGPAGQPGGGLRQGLRHGRRGVEPEPHAGARGRVRRAPTSSKEELFSTSDFISIHVVLSDRTRGLIGAADFARMKPIGDTGQHLARADRGRSGIDRGDQQRKFAHAALDVYSREPLPARSPVAPHGERHAVTAPGLLNTDVFEHFYGESVKNIEAWLDGKPINVVNPEVLKK